MAAQTPKPLTLLSQTLSSNLRPSKSSRKVVVIGAGAAGLVAALELRREGHRVVVFECGDKVGGTWNYNPDVESDSLGLDPSRRIVHSSMYDSLRTNLPREVMGFHDFPFVVRDGRDTRRFPCHQEVFLYLDDFARAFDLKELIRFDTEVFGVRLVGEGRWMVRSRRVLMDGEDEMVDVEEVYDGVVVCNGHHTEPRIADIPGTFNTPKALMQFVKDLPAGTICGRFHSCTFFASLMWYVDHMQLDNIIKCARPNNP